MGKIFKKLFFTNHVQNQRNLLCSIYATMRDELANSIQIILFLFIIVFTSKNKYLLFLYLAIIPKHCMNVIIVTLTIIYKKSL